MAELNPKTVLAVDVEIGHLGQTKWVVLTDYGDGVHQFIHSENIVHCNMKFVLEKTCALAAIHNPISVVLDRSTTTMDVMYALQMDGINARQIFLRGQEQFATLMKIRAGMNSGKVRLSETFLPVIEMQSAMILAYWFNTNRGQVDFA
jgi:hypothetical protein